MHHCTPGFLRVGALAVIATLACNGDSETSAGSETATTTATATATAGTATITSDATETATTTATSASGSESGTGETTTATTTITTTSTTSETATSEATTATTTGTTAEPTTTTGVDTSGSTSDTGGMSCDLEEVKDTLAFTYAKKFDTGITDPVLQATYYNGDADEVMIMSFSGKARRFALDGTPLSDVFDVPPEAQPQLDGATYDPILGRGLLITQSCVLTEVEPQTLAVIESKALGFGMSICAGLALGLDDNLYIASYGTNEMVVLSRDGQTLIRRFNMIDKVGLTGFDGVTLIAGSENFLVMSTSPSADAAIIDGFGNVLVPKAPIGQAMAPLIGGMPMLPDAVLTICGNGHAWLCEAYNATCFDYAPEDGDKDACPCLIPQ